MINIVSKKFGQTKDGQDVTAFEMHNSNGMTVTILDFGATIQSIVFKDCSDKPLDIVLGYDDVASYENGTCFYGAIVGRYANRIGNARYVLDGKEYQLEKSIGENNHVHGIFAKRMFKPTVCGEKLLLRYYSPDMEEGFPGNVSVEIGYHLSEENELEITYKATTDATTIVNLTNHCYFNFHGQDGSTIFDHSAQFNCSAFSEYNEDFSQSGNIIPVDNSPLDFREEHTIGSRFNDDYHQLRICTGYDHNMIIDGKIGEFRKVGTCKCDSTGIAMDIFTTEPAMQFYTANYIHYDSAKQGKNGIRYPKNGGFCVEAQHYPDSINHSNFPNTILRVGEEYRQRTVYKFYNCD